MKDLYIKNEVWSIVPARSGSRGIKKKNLQKILGYSLLNYTISASKKSKHIIRTFVSTDSEAFRSEALRCGAEVPFLRSKKNSSDTATDFHVIYEFINKLIETKSIIPKYFIYLLPTTPFRDPKILDSAIIKFKKIKKYDSLVSVCQMDAPVHKKFFIKNNRLKPVFSNLSLDDAHKPRQNFPKSFTNNGYMSIVKTRNILKKISLGVNCFPFIVPKSIDIDNKQDLLFARYAAKKIYKIKKNKKNV